MISSRCIWHHYVWKNFDMMLFYLLLMLPVKLTVGIYFTKSSYTFRVYTNSSTTFVGKVYSFVNRDDACRDDPHIIYTINTRHAPNVTSGNQTADFNAVFEIDNTGAIHLSRPSTHTLGTHSGLIHAKVGCSETKTEATPAATAHVTLYINNVASTHRDEPDFHELCWGIDELNFQISENNVVPLLFGSLQTSKQETVETEYTVIEGGDMLSVDKTTSEVSLWKSLDRETQDQWQFTFNCQVKTGNDVIHKSNSTVKVKVIDADDNPPYFQKDDTQWKEKNISLQTKRLHVFLVDRDLATAATYSARVVNDSGSLVKSVELTVFTSRPLTARHLRHTLPFISVIDIYLQFNQLSVESATSVYVIVTDRHFHPTTPQVSNAVTLKLNVVPVTKQSQVTLQEKYTATLSKNATRFAQILRLTQRSSLKGAAFSINRTTPYTRMFDISPQDGIVYVRDPVLLEAFDNSVVKVVVDVKLSSLLTVQKIVVISLVQRKSSHSDDCELSCSRFSTMASCQSSCGLGAGSGLCRWRPGYPKKMSHFFQTCTPSMDTCVDRVCDGVERLNKFICPQDCTTNGPRGEWLKNSLTGQGIALAKGTCWCDHNARCTCVSEYKDTTTVAEMKIEKIESCNRMCKITVGASVACLLIIALTGFSVCWQCRHRQRRSRALKDVASIIYTSSEAPEPAEDRERPPTDRSPQCSPATRTTSQFDAKWEFPRQHLVLQETLGEGEFGQVVKARAWGLEGDEKWSQVAVKMLKPDATGSEFQDLMSELNLLKEVNHPNVIRLLGACTQSGPFYVIVEFCQYGCLKSYLRGARYNGRPSWDEKQDASASNRKRNPATLTLSNLLSFARQIAKGMEYLSIMKLIHRDLAARNVLVAEDNLVKISDFGLSRDVYEADTYLKMSKGRIPVKWMAPESLYAQIYTTKSDIWSFGIVLWELTTLGANPYPGIVPERLFNLLKTGYRMDRPDDCTEEMYAVMQKCWKTAPEQRPSFTVLANILDSMLQQHREYLQLSNEVTYTETIICTEENGDNFHDVENGYGSISQIPLTPNHPTEIAESPEDNEQSDCEECDAFLPKSEQLPTTAKSAPSSQTIWNLNLATPGNIST